MKKIKFLSILIAVGLLGCGRGSEQFPGSSFNTHSSVLPCSAANSICSFQVSGTSPINYSWTTTSVAGSNFSISVCTASACYASVYAVSCSTDVSCTSFFPVSVTSNANNGNIKTLSFTDTASVLDQSVQSIHIENQSGSKVQAVINR